PPPSALHPFPTRRSSDLSGTDLSRDEGLHHLVRAVGLRTGLGDPFVHALLEHLELAIAAGRAIRGGEFLLHRRQHVVVELALHEDRKSTRLNSSHVKISY